MAVNQLQHAHDDGERLDQFESEWRRGSPPDLRAYIRETKDNKPRFICDLIELDLEYRWKRFHLKDADSSSDDRGFPMFPRLEDYALLLPNELRDQVLTPNLVAEEYRVRIRWGDRPERQSFLERFHVDPAAIETALNHIDTELADEAVNLGEDRASDAHAGQPSIGSPDGESDEAVESLSVGAAEAPTLEWKDSTDDGEPATGPRQIGKYEIRGKVGAGGMGVVFKAWDDDLQQLVAVKIVRSGQFASPQELEYFRREGRALARVRHENVVSVYYAELDHSPPYIVMEWLPRGHLRKHFDRYQGDLRESVQLVEKIARAVHQIHQCKLLHRDLKPANVLLDDKDEPKVTDFGLVTLLDRNLEASKSVAEVGTPPYMAPEQTSLVTLKVSVATDVWALGVMLYELLCGKLPFRGEDRVKLYRAICYDDPVRPISLRSDLDVGLESLVLKCLEKDGRRRFASAEAFADELHRWLCGEELQTRPFGRIQRAFRRGKRHAGILIPVAFVLVAVGITAVVTMMFDNSTPEAVSLTTVHVSTEPPGARVAFVLLDELSGRPIVDSIVQSPPGQVTPLKMELEAGLYWVEAQVDGHGFHEVFRTVPADTMRPIGQHNHLTWTDLDNDAIIELPPIRIPTVDDAVVDLVEIEGGAVPIGARKDVSTVRPFHLATMEVSIRDWEQAGMLLTPGLDTSNRDCAISEVSWDQAVAYAESTGCRLPTREEFIFVATNGGRTRFPWGDDAGRIVTWPFESVGTPRTDATMRAPVVYGLYSNVAEWTMTWWIPESSRPDRLPPTITDRLPHTRTVEGGPTSVFNRELESEDWLSGFDHAPNGVYRDVMQPGIGLRCARSTSPRYLSLSH